MVFAGQPFGSATCNSNHVLRSSVVPDPSSSSSSHSPAQLPDQVRSEAVDHGHDLFNVKRRRTSIDVCLIPAPACTISLDDFSAEHSLGLDLADAVRRSKLAAGKRGSS